MRNRFFIVSTVAAAVLALMIGCGGASDPSGNGKLATSTPKGNAAIRVGVFNGHGGAQTCVWEAYEALRRDAEMRPYYVTSADLAGGALDTLDAFIIPGGGGSRQWLNLGAKNHERIATFAENGGGVLGICAGAYLLSSTPQYACLGLSKGVAIDIAHDNRGHGVANVTLSALGKELFPELATLDTLRVMYYEGPVYDTTQRAYDVFATMESDVHTEGDAPTNMTNGRPFLIGNAAGQGRVMACIAHPEATPGMQWMIPRMVRWTLQRELTPYTDSIVNPSLFTQECLVDEAMLQREKGIYNTLLYGTADEKLESLKWLQSVLSWDAKRWVQGLLYDGDPRVRAAAAEYIARMGYTHYLPDVSAAAVAESDEQAKSQISRAKETLRGQIAAPNR